MGLPYGTEIPLCLFFFQIRSLDILRFWSKVYLYVK